LQVLHLMRCPSGLVWDNVHKLCMESSSTCHAALGTAAASAAHAHAAAPAPIDSYMQYFAKLAAAASSASEPGHDDPAGHRRDDALMQPRVKEQAGAAADASS